MKYPDDLKVTLIHGDCLEEMKKMESNSVDSICCDPPYGLSFMGKKWDYDVPSEDIWRECLRVLKPGGHLLAFSGTRTYHRMACAIEDAGFEIRDMIAWIYGSGFPKSLNIGKAVDKLQGNEREITGSYKVPDIKGDAYGTMNDKQGGSYKNIEVNKTKGTSEWEGWGTALKPALEPITVARKPLIGTVAENVLTHGTGGMNIDQCRVATDDTYTANGMASLGVMHDDNWEPKTISQQMHTQGRFPANLIHDGSEEVLTLFPTSSGGAFPKKINGTSPIAFRGDEERESRIEMKDKGSAARFFYCAKASKKDRDEGLEGFELRNASKMSGGTFSNQDCTSTTNKDRSRANNHPTVKPTDLMRYLCRLVTPPGGIVLDPFTGSGSTGKAAVKEGFSFIGIEREAEYVEIAKARIGI